MRRSFGPALTKAVLALVSVTSIGTAHLPAQPASNCKVGKEDVPWSFPACALRSAGGNQYLPTNYLKGLKFNEYDLTWVHVVPGDFVYVNRSGKIVVHDVSVMDNGADWFHHGLVRLERQGKFGFADSKGHIVVPIIYEGAGNGPDGPSVCVGCNVVRVGEYNEFRGGYWFQVDVHGRMVGPAKP